MFNSLADIIGIPEGNQNKLKMLLIFIIYCRSN